MEGKWKRQGGCRAGRGFLPGRSIRAGRGEDIYCRKLIFVDLISCPAYHSKQEKQSERRL